MDRISHILSSLVNNETVSSGRYSGYDLSAINELLALSGSPHLEGKFVHIAGTNGKGSVAWMLAVILQETGLRTGLYTSPHLLTINERIRVDMLPIGDEALERYVRTLEKHLESMHASPTWFDAVTWAAFCHFADSKVDIAIMETGLGGRLDSTNVIKPEVSIITEIAMDHAALLGKSLKKIAYEKAGIIKQGVPVIAAAGPGSSLRVIRERAQTERSPLLAEGDDFETSSIHAADGGGTLFNFSCNSTLTGFMDIKDIFISSDCTIQARNAGMAVTAAAMLADRQPAELEQQVRNALGSLSIPGRCEKLFDIPIVYFDPAHNPAALQTILESIRHRFPHHELTIVASFMKDKDHEEMLSILCSHGVQHLVYHVLEDPRCFVPDSHSLNAFGDARVTHSKKDLFQLLEQQGRTAGIILFTGSFRLYQAASEFITYLESVK